MKTRFLTTELAAYGSLIRRMAKDHRLVATHVSVFTALFVQWQRSSLTALSRSHEGN